MILIAISPLILYFHLCFPTTKSWETLFFTLTSNYYENIQTLIWTLLEKGTTLYLLIIWFLTSKNWWNKVILIPIGVLSYQIINLLNDDLISQDTALDSIVVFPVIIAVCYLLLKLRNKLAYKVELLDLKEKVDAEFEKVKKELKERIKTV